MKIECFKRECLKNAWVKKRSAQQLVEFLLVVPFMVIIFGILTEYAYALNIDMTLQEGLKTVSSQLYSKIKPGLTQSQIKDLVKTDLTNYLSENRVPINAENAITVGYDIEGSSAVFMASYKYIPAFSLPNVFFKFMPDEFNFFANSVVPTAFLSENNYNSTDSIALDGIWAGPVSFGSLDAFNDSKKGIMKDGVGNNKVLFLVPTTTTATTASGLTNAYALIDWGGNSVGNYTANTTDGKLYTCGASLCTDSGNKFSTYASGKGYSNIIFVHDDEASDVSNLSASWLNPSGSVDISAPSVDGILKRTLGLITLDNKTVGNYDGVSSNYSLFYGNSMVFLYMPASDFNIVKLTQ